MTQQNEMAIAGDAALRTLNNQLQTVRLGAVLLLLLQLSLFCGTDHYQICRNSSVPAQRDTQEIIASSKPTVNQAARPVQQGHRTDADEPKSSLPLASAWCR